MVGMAIGHIVEGRNGLRCHSLPEWKPVRQQAAYSCVPASLAYGYQILGLNVKERVIARDMDLDGDGACWSDVIRNVYDNGVDFSFYTHANYDDLLNVQIEKNSPIIVFWNSARDPEYIGLHASVVQEINEAFIVLMDPAFADFYEMEREEFEKVWRDDEDEDTRSFLVLSL
jgi:predicted double-glycine peptidase